MKQYTFPGVSTSWRASGVIDLHDGTKSVFFIQDCIRQGASEMVLPKSAACANCTELRRIEDEYICAPFRSSDKFRWSYNPVSLTNMDREQAVCPLYSREDPAIVTKALNILWNAFSDDDAVGRALKKIWKFPNATLKSGNIPKTPSLT